MTPLANITDELNLTHAEHAIVAVTIQAIVTALAWPLFGMTPAVIWLCALPGSFLFFGREHAQAERRLQVKRATDGLPWAITFEAMKWWQWNADSQLDFLCPVLANALLGGVICWIFC